MLFTIFSVVRPFNSFWPIDETWVYVCNALIKCHVYIIIPSDRIVWLLFCCCLLLLFVCCCCFFFVVLFYFFVFFLYDWFVVGGFAFKGRGGDVLHILPVCQLVEFPTHANPFRAMQTNISNSSCVVLKMVNVYVLISAFKL